MKTEDLIATLGAEAGPPEGATLRSRAAIGLALGGMATVVLFALILGPRPGLTSALEQPVTVAKTLLPLILGVFSLGVVLRTSRPTMRAGTGGRLMLVVPAVAVALFGWAMLYSPAGQRLALFLGHSIQVCLPSIPMLSAPLLAGLLVALRRGAPARPWRNGALAGLAAGGFATTIYSLFCTEDSPLFYVTWYGLAILIVTAAGALIGARALRW